MHDMVETARQVRRTWSSLGLILSPGATVEEIEAFERKYGVCLTDSVRSFYGVVNGMVEGNTDRSYIRFWPLSEVSPVSEELTLTDHQRAELEGYFVFADYSMWVHGYAVQLSKGANTSDSVVIVDGESVRNISGSFAAFVEQYAKDPVEIL